MDSRLDEDGTVCDFRSDLNGFDNRIVAERERNAVVDARSPADFFEVGAGADRGRQDAGVRAHAHDQLVAAGADGPADIKNGSGETREMIADLDSIEPYRGAELRFVNTENGHAANGGDFEHAAIPEPVAFLT